MSNTFEEKPLPKIYYEEDMTPRDEKWEVPSQSEGTDIFSAEGRKKFHAAENSESEETDAEVRGSIVEPRYPLSDVDIRRGIVLGVLDSGIGETADDVKSASKILTDFVLNGE